MNKFLILFIFLLLILSCSPKDKSTQTNSSTFSTYKEKLDFFTQYVHLKSEILDLEYSIFYKDNTSGRISPSGPSDWDIKVAIKLDPKLMDKWIENSYPLNKPIQFNIWNDMKLDPDQWNLKNENKLYTEPNKIIATYKKDSILLLYYSTLTSLNF